MVRHIGQGRIEKATAIPDPRAVKGIHSDRWNDDDCGVAK
jgi:hypothetical protein